MCVSLGFLSWLVYVLVHMQCSVSHVTRASVSHDLDCFPTLLTIFSLRARAQYRVEKLEQAVKKAVGVEWLINPKNESKTDVCYSHLSAQQRRKLITNLADRLSTDFLGTDDRLTKVLFPPPPYLAWHFSCHFCLYLFPYHSLSVSLPPVFSPPMIMYSLSYCRFVVDFL
jgi:hypothetical protein